MNGNYVLVKEKVYSSKSAQQSKYIWIDCKYIIRLGVQYKRVTLGRICCFCLSQAARDVQQVQETMNSPLCANGLVSRSQVKAVWLRETTNALQAADMRSCHMLREEGLIANRMGIHKFLQKHREMNNIERRPGEGQRWNNCGSVARSSSTQSSLIVFSTPNCSW